MYAKLENEIIFSQTVRATVLRHFHLWVIFRREVTSNDNFVRPAIRLFVVTVSALRAVCVSKHFFFYLALIIFHLNICT